MSKVSSSGNVIGVVCSIEFLATSWPSTDSTPVPPLPKPFPSDLKSNTMVCFPGLSSGPSQVVRLRSEQVIEEHHLAPAEAEFALAQEQAVAAEAPALGDDHAFGAALGDRDLRRDGVGLVQDA